jgi:excisionase family DNA binding protein
VLLAELERDKHARAQLAEMLDLRLGAARVQAQQSEAWLNTTTAAEYLGISRNALHKLTAAREIPFEQDGPGCKCWFHRPDLDAWRRGQNPDAAKTQPRTPSGPLRDLSRS